MNICHNITTNSFSSGGAGKAITIYFNLISHNNILNAAEEISDMLDDMKYSTDHPINPRLFKSLIHDIIDKNVKFDIIYAP